MSIFFDMKQSHPSFFKVWFVKVSWKIRGGKQTKILSWSDASNSVQHSAINSVSLSLNMTLTFLSIYSRTEQWVFVVVFSDTEASNSLLLFLKKIPLNSDPLSGSVVSSFPKSRFEMLHLFLIGIMGDKILGFRKLVIYFPHRVLGIAGE